MCWHQVWRPSKSLELFCPMCCAPTFPLPVLAQPRSAERPINHADAVYYMHVHNNLPVEVFLGRDNVSER